MQRRALRNVPGRKDCQWIAELHEHGLLAQLARRAMRKKIPGLQMACAAGSPPRTARCADCTWTPATTSPRRSQNGTS